ncbi:MAG: hypothetical protein R6U63_03545 [Longimicrobiales bacterium]
MKRFSTATFAFFASFAMIFAAFAPSRAQEPDTTMPSGVRLRLVYQTEYRDRVAVQPFTGQGLGRAQEEVHRIIRRDLDYSDRFEMLHTIPVALQEGTADYAAWNDLGVVYLVTGSMEGLDEGGYGLRLALHDVVYGSVREIQYFELPPLDDPDFRMAVHATADEVVRWATGEPGIAATRLVLTRLRADGRHELLVVDSDGENLRRITEDESIYSPIWSPDGGRVAFSATDYVESDRIVVRTMATGAEETITERGLPAQTPAFAPDGGRLAVALWLDRGMEIHDYDLDRDCCLRRLSRGSRIDMHPSYSPDGRRIVFQSDRLGNPQIFTMPADGGDAVLITPFELEGPGYYTSPEWSPRTSQVVFHGRSRGGVFQVMVANADRPGGTVQQITAEGRSEDPSWAPDGRHIVFSGVREDGMGLYVIDLVTGRIRPLVTGGRYRMPSWSPVLMDASELVAAR